MEQQPEGGGGGGGGGPLLEDDNINSSGNRWPREETLALLKIRSEMDSIFRDASFKGPLWEQVSRKLGELGYKRSSKKCKEKFENVQKYYKRTKEGRGGRQDGKSYRFFSELEAMHNITMNASPNMTQNRAQPPMQVSAPTPIASAPPPLTAFTVAKQEDVNVGSKLISFSSNTNSFSTGSEFEEEGEEEEAMESGKKRKREENKDGKMMEFFEGLMKQVMERQESMQKRFMDALEKREQERLIREEAWRRQEMSRIARENEIAANERAAVMARDAVIFSILQKATGQAVPFPLSPHAATPPAPLATPQPPQPPQQMQTQVQEMVQRTSPIQPAPSSVSYELVPMTSIGSQIMDPTSSRWPKLEVHALIQLRSELDSRYQENGPKGPLWEEISSGMQKLGYNRSAKRCKEKWENINKYFRKVKESNKKRPDDAKTCPYFHQLDALYRNKQFINNNIGGATLHALDQNVNLNPTPITIVAPMQGEVENKCGNGGGVSRNGEVASASALFGEGTPNLGEDGSGMILKKPEDIVKELMGQSNYDGDIASDDMDEDEEDDEDDDNEDGKGQYRIQFQNQTSANNNASNNTEAPKTSGKTSGSYLAMVR